MPLTEVQDSASFGAILAADVIDASGGVLFRGNANNGAAAGANANQGNQQGTARIAPNTNSRTIFIGLGGTGVQTVDYVKGEIDRRMAPTWRNYVAFLGIDSDRDEFNKARYLDSNTEEAYITRQGVDGRAADENRFPYAWRSVSDRKLSAVILNTEGCSQTRLFGRMKIHDQEPARSGVDDEIIGKISTAVNTLTAIPANNGNGQNGGEYEVFVIGSVSGGTCSGTFLEMPYLIHKAMENIMAPVRIYAMLFLPDTVSGLDPVNIPNLQANGYASLKELDYFQSLTMREGYPETKYYNNYGNANKTITLNQQTEFFSMPLLFPSRNGVAREAIEVAKAELAEFILNMVGDITFQGGQQFQGLRSFLSNALTAINNKPVSPANPNQEAPGEYHEFPKHYAAVGYAQAAVPKQVVYAAEAGQICKKAGLKPISDAARAQLPPEQLMPFRGKDNLWDETQSNGYIQELLSSLENLLSDVHSCDFGFAAHFMHNTSLTWEQIHAGQFSTKMYKDGCDKYVAEHTDIHLLDELKAKVQGYYNKFETAVRNFVKKEGPQAFVNLFDGIYAAENGIQAEIGIKSRLKQLREGNQTDGRPYGKWMAPQQAKEKFEDAQKDINRHVSRKILGLLPIDTETKQAQANEWERSYSRWVRMRVIEKRRDFVFGRNGLFDTEFYQKACLLRDRLEAFGKVLSAMSDAYGNQSDKMESFEACQAMTVGTCIVNIAAQSQSAYDWINRQMQAALAQAQEKVFRDDLVDDFFGNQAEWMNTEGRIKESAAGNGAYQLVLQGRPVEARVRFDKQVAGYLTNTLNVSIAALLQQMAPQAQDINGVVSGILQQLHAQSCIPAGINVAANYMYVTYPSNLAAAANGPAIVNAIQNATTQIFGGNAQALASNNTDSISAFQFAAPFPIYKLRGLATWQGAYNARINDHNAYMHGMSQDLKITVNNGAISFAEGYTWKDYPSIVPQPGVVDPKLQAEINTAKRLGILQCQQDQNGCYHVIRVYFDDNTDWQFDITVAQNLDLGAALVAEVARQNNTTIAAISRQVRLAEGGLVDKDGYLTAKDAWYWASRILRVHMPMRAEIRDSCAKAQVWNAQAEKFVMAARVRQKPDQMMLMIKSHLIEDNNGVWNLNKPEGQITLANLSGAMKPYWLPETAQLVNNGFRMFYIFKALCSKVNDMDSYQALYDLALNRYQELLQKQDMAALNAGKKLADTALQEKADLRAKGAPLDPNGTANLPYGFVNNMRGIIADESLLREIDSFYGRISDQ